MRQRRRGKDGTYKRPYDSPPWGAVWDKKEGMWAIKNQGGDAAATAAAGEARRLNLSIEEEAPGGRSENLKPDDVAAAVAKKKKKAASPKALMRDSLVLNPQPYGRDDENAFDNGEEISHPNEIAAAAAAASNNRNQNQNTGISWKTTPTRSSVHPPAVMKICGPPRRESTSI